MTVWDWHAAHSVNGTETIWLKFCFLICNVYKGADLPALRPFVLTYEGNLWLITGLLLQIYLYNIFVVAYRGNFFAILALHTLM